MDEKLQELLYKAQAAAADVGNTAAAVAVSAVRGAEELMESGKRKARSMELQGEINLLLRQIGEMVYATHTGAPSNSDALFEKLHLIDQRKAELKTLQPSASEACGQEPAGVCAACGAAARAGDLFCRNCGARL